MQSNYLLARRTLLLHEDGVQSALVGSLTQNFHPITVAGQRWNLTILPPPDQFFGFLIGQLNQYKTKAGRRKIAPLRLAIACFSSGLLDLYLFNRLKRSLKTDPFSSGHSVKLCDKSPLVDSH
ncbi:hypothetical protein BH11CYA1_BH11CYA1_02770 [soil metagenome]